jgi:hypothetical protein
MVPESNNGCLSGSSPALTTQLLHNQFLFLPCVYEHAAGFFKQFGEAKDISYIKHIKRKNMNIQNLNSQEQEQLQTLLNKMNEPTPIKQDPVEEMIKGIMEYFEWRRVQEVMDYLDWRWRGEYVTIEMLKETAEELLRSAIDSRLNGFKDKSWETGIINATGGLQAEAWCDESKTKIVALDLKFILTDWDEYAINQ